ncbi:ferritin-like domain-containing protein [Kineococcus sp. NBC_00420]|uniref:ferritin-like domain-containing protein n=1 Tax=unclassified Kineococcus TaxID=2621656 RepID=UPI002E1A358F
MFGNKLVKTMIDRSAETGADRRNFLRTAGLAGLGVAGAAAVGTGGASSAFADSNPPSSAQPNGQTANGELISDATILNFALNLEYLEAEFYSYAAFGHGLSNSDIDGNYNIGAVTGGSKVPFKSSSVRKIAEDIAHDEVAHVKFLRSALGTVKVARPTIDLVGSFTAAAQAAGLIKAGQSFNPFADEASFLLGAFLFEDVGVTAYKGAAPLITNKTYLDAAAGILAFEAYHAATIRTTLVARGQGAAADAISNARDSLDGPTDLDQGVNGSKGSIIVAPGDVNGVAYSRTFGQVLNVVFLNPGKTDRGGFFPDGVHGDIRASDAH